MARNSFNSRWASSNWVLRAQAWHGCRCGKPQIWPRQCELANPDHLVTSIKCPTVHEFKGHSSKHAKCKIARAIFNEHWMVMEPLGSIQLARRGWTFDSAAGEYAVAFGKPLVWDTLRMALGQPKAFEHGQPAPQPCAQKRTTQWETMDMIDMCPLEI